MRTWLRPGIFFGGCWCWFCVYGLIRDGVFLMGRFLYFGDGNGLDVGFFETIMTLGGVG